MDSERQPPLADEAVGDPVFDLSLPKLLVLAVIALVVFGPNELPKMAAKAGKALRELRQIAEGARCLSDRGIHHTSSRYGSNASMETLTVGSASEPHNSVPSKTTL